MIDFRQGSCQWLGTRLCKLLPTGIYRNTRSYLKIREWTEALQDMPWQPRVPQFTLEDLQLLELLKGEITNELRQAAIINDCDVLYLALKELQSALRSADREDKILRFRFYLSQSVDRT